MLKLRPHHLLCVQAYIGKGYSQEFVKNMNQVVKQLQEDPHQKIQLVDDLDRICSQCPNKIGNMECVSNQKVKALDQKTLVTLGIIPKEYTYDFLLQRLQEKLNKETFKHICSECEWYSSHICSQRLKEKGYF